jgi:hypothetical protein
MPVALQSHGFTMKHQPAQLHETMAFIARDHAEMVNTLAIALAIGQYLATLSKAERPMKAFDALFGLIAIALGGKVAAASILPEIRSLKQALGGRHVAHAD